MSQKTRLAIAAFLLVGLTVGSVWLGSGSISPYASTYSHAESDECGYLYNIDHWHFLNTFQMLNGDPKHIWAGSVVLRRVLYPIIAYPFMTHWGFNLGGFITNLAIAGLTSLVLIISLFKRFGERAAIVGGLLFATYPGLTYFGGLPYSYFFIAPATVFAFTTLHWLADSPTMVRSLGTGMFLGILATGYDLLPFFLPTSLIILLSRRRVLPLLPLALTMLAPMAFVLWYQTEVMGLSVSNSNSKIYASIADAIRNPTKERYTEWLGLITQTPGIFLHNFTFSAFAALPVAFCLAYLSSRWTLRAKLSTPEWSFLVVAGGLWIFNNFAPPYPGWQMRGTWIARIYQPVFIVYIFYLARVSALTSKKHIASAIVLLIAVACALFQEFVVASPIFGMYRVAGQVYHEFYQHAPVESFATHMNACGARPRGFCKRT
jgi:hypothetical protein